ncbi:MAG: hypothetical protein ACFN4W_09690 [Segatella oris]
MTKDILKVLNPLNVLCFFIVVTLFTACTSNETTETDLETRRQVNGFKVSVSQTYKADFPTTRARLDTEGKFFWEKGDKVTIFNFNTFYTSTAEAAEAGASTHFEGKMTAKRGDRIAMFYPAINNETVRQGHFGHLYLDIGKQKGTLEDFTNRFFFKFGLGGVDKVSNDIASVYANLQSQVSLCNCKITFKKNGQTLMTKKLKITNAPSVATLNLNTNNPNGDLQMHHSAQTDVIDVDPSSAVAVTHIAMFPTKQEETYTLTVEGGDGKTYNVKQKMMLVAGKFYNFIIELGNPDTPDSPAGCGGVKWAESNFILYNLCHSWNQSSYGFYHKPWNSNATIHEGQRRHNGYRICDTFRWGVIGEAAWNPNCHYCPPRGNREISGKMFTDPEMLHETKDFCKARYGDIVYWATCGKLRLPTAEEMTTLFTSYSWENGFFSEYCQKSAYGFMFTCPPKGTVRITRYNAHCPKRFSWNDLYNGTFLPFAFYRTGNGCWAWNRCVSRYMTSTLTQGSVDTWSFGHHVNPYGNESDWKTDKPCDAHTLRSLHSPYEFMPIRAVYVDNK